VAWTPDGIARREQVAKRSAPFLHATAPPEVHYSRYPCLQLFNFALLARSLPDESGWPRVVHKFTVRHWRCMTDVLRSRQLNPYEAWDSTEDLLSASHTLLCILPQMCSAKAAVSAKLGLPSFERASGF
jgi:hypothetical protein